jgi:general secretion pathway protein D
VVDNLVYFTVQSQVSQGVGVGSTNLTSVTTTPNTVPVGIVMSVTPQISASGVVNINVRPTISSLLRYVPDPNPVIPAGFNQGIPEIQVREMESLLQINSGSVAVLGGLMQDVIQRNSDHVPGLYKIPLIGRLFTAQSDLYKKTELVIFLKPTVIADPALQSAELGRFRQFLPASRLDERANLPEAVR